MTLPLQGVFSARPQTKQVAYRKSGRRERVLAKRRRGKKLRFFPNGGTRGHCRPACRICLHSDDMLTRVRWHRQPTWYRVCVKVTDGAAINPWAGGHSSQPLTPERLSPRGKR